MIFDDLKRIMQTNAANPNGTYLLNLLKEKLQDYILYFVYTRQELNELIFTGGTCLRKVYGLNRLSVDLDFDYKGGNFSHDDFVERLTDWFEKTYQVKNVSAIRRKETINLKLSGGLEAFPAIGRQIIFVSVDISPLRFEQYGVEKSLISTPEFSFFATHFDLPTMFANKICAFLKREFLFGDEQTVSFKARDVYDLFWFCQRSRQGGYRLRPRTERLFEELKTNSMDEIRTQVVEKVGQLHDDQILNQLQPFFPDPEFVKEFVTVYKKVLVKESDYIF